MKQLFAIMALAAVAASATAQNVTIDRNEYGSGVPGAKGPENAAFVENDIFHAPQYLPYFPTAATIWPRVVEVQCVRTPGTGIQSGLKCEGYNWTPKMGRGEYLFFKPRVIEPVQVEVVRERTIIKEVPRKKLKE